MLKLWIAALSGPALVLLLAIYFVVATIPRAGSAPLRCDVVGEASWYGSESGNRTATGEHFDGSSMTAALPAHARTRLGLGERYRVHYGPNSVVVRINDTGGFAKYGRVVDLSRAAAVAIGLIAPGHGKVCLVHLP